MKKTLKFLTLLIIILAFATSAFATTSTVQNGSIYMDFSDCKLANKQIECELYQITSISEAGIHAVESDFEDANLNIYKLANSAYDSIYWKNNAKNIDNYINRETPTPKMTFTTDVNGHYQVRNLDWGIYFIQIDSICVPGCEYFFNPILVMIGCPGNPPNAEEDFTVVPKVTVEYDKPTKPDDPDTPDKDYDLSVEKIWKNTSSDELILDVITVEIYCNGKLYKTVELSEKNMWKYSWTDDNKDNVWSVKEIENMTNFTTDYEKNAYKFTIINTYEKPEIPKIPDDPEDPEDPDEPDTPDEPDDEDDEELVETGYYGYLIPVFASIGVISILLGMILRRKTNANN